MSNTNEHTQNENDKGSKNSIDWTSIILAVIFCIFLPITIIVGVIIYQKNQQEHERIMANKSSGEKGNELEIKRQEGKTQIWAKLITGLTKIGGSAIDLFN